MITIKLTIKDQVIELTIDEARQLQKELEAILGIPNFPVLNRDINAAYGPLPKSPSGISVETEEREKYFNELSKQRLGKGL